MINLLPKDVKQGVTYGRHNTKLAKWALAFGVAVIGAVVIMVIGLLYIRKSVNSYTAQVQNQQEELKLQKLDETQAKVESISNDLKLTVQVLSKEVLFSKLIQQIGAAIPSKASLSDLKINKLQGGLDITAIASDYTTASQVQVNLQDPANKIFDKADIINITCNGNGGLDPRYPCTVTLRAQFAKDNPFLFINSSGGGGS